jgi:HEPN superfamily RiboL-PSP-like protein
MPSRALLAFTAGLSEIADLKNVIRPSLAADESLSLRLARVGGRAQVVLLSAHFERYFYAVNEEAVEFVNSQNIAATALSENLRLLHSRYPIDEMAETSWERRSAQLAAFILGDGWLWSSTVNGALSHERLLAWLRAPKPADLQRYYRYWNIDDIFARITRTPGARSKLWLGVQELVDIRNNIAHGDFASQPTQIDVQRYARSATIFCRRADRQLSRALARLATGSIPW